jgi:hypothetical protein
MISNPESDNVVVNDLFGLLVEQTPISLDEQKRKINKLEAELKAEKEAYEKNKQSNRFDELFNKIKELPRTEELMAQLEALVPRMIPDEPIVHEPIVNEPVAIKSKDRLENLPDRIVLGAYYAINKHTYKIIYNKLNKKFYRYDQTNPTCYNSLSHAYNSLFNKAGNAWERFKACEIEGNGKSPIDTIDKIKLVVDNSDKYCDKNFVFTRL